MNTLTHTKFLKNIFQRERPSHNDNIKRIRNMRGKETCASFPSGDAAAVACFSFFMFEHMSDVVERFPG